MRQGNNPRRGRGRPGRRPNVPARAQNFESNGPEGRVRGNAAQVYEKYLQLARDAQSAGDRVLAESFQQHAEHYYRIINDSTDPNNRPQPQREQRAEERYDEDEEQGVENGERDAGNGRRQERYERSDRHPARYEDRRQQARAGDPRYTEARGESAAPAEQPEPQGEEPVAAPAAAGEAEATAQAGGGEAPAETAVAEEAPAPRRTRRTTTRRTTKSKSDDEDAGLLKMLGEPRRPANGSANGEVEPEAQAAAQERTGEPAGEPTGEPEVKTPPKPRRRRTTKAANASDQADSKVDA